MQQLKVRTYDKNPLKTNVSVQTENYILNACKHIPGVIRFFGGMTPQGKSLNSLIEYCAGGEVADKVKILNRQQKISIIKQLFNTLSLMHQSQLYHCDIKAANILLEQQFSPENNEPAIRLIDMGLAKKKPYNAERYANRDIIQLGTTIFSLLTDNYSFEKLRILDSKEFEYIAASIYESLNVEKTLQNAMTNPLTDLFSNEEKQQLFNLLKGMLEFDTTKRISLEQAKTQFQQIFQ